jgi:hypothetical protein
MTQNMTLDMTTWTVIRSRPVRWMSAQPRVLTGACCR